MPKNQRRRTRRNENQKTVSDVRSETVFCDRKRIVCIYYGELQGIIGKEKKWKSILHCP